jgi:hypothetical protein
LRLDSIIKPPSRSQVKSDLCRDAGDCADLLFHRKHRGGSSCSLEGDESKSAPRRLKSYADAVSLGLFSVGSVPPSPESRRCRKVRFATSPLVVHFLSEAKPAQVGHFRACAWPMLSVGLNWERQNEVQCLKLVPSASMPHKSSVPDVSSCCKTWLRSDSLEKQSLARFATVPPSFERSAREASPEQS